MTTRTILLAARIGEASRGPARTAAWLASELGARVTLLYVAVELTAAAAVSTATGVDLEEVRERMRREARERAERLAAELLGSVPFEVEVGEGEVAREVAAVAARTGAVLIVTGQQGRGSVRAAILGDTTRDILQRAPCPVVVVPPEEEEE